MATGTSELVDDTGPVTDAELAAMAVAADPDTPVEEGAVPFSQLTGTADEDDGLLPAWYMPAPGSGGRLRGWRRRVAILTVSSFLAINAYGLCSTYGSVGLR